MPTPHPPRPPYPPPGGVAGGTPTTTSPPICAAVRDGEAAQSAALLMARHWQPVHEYAVICLAARSEVASMVTAAAFHQVLDRLALGEPATALRPRLLVRARDTVREWSTEDRISGVLPDLVKPAGGRGMRAAKSMTPENRKLAERSFLALPGLARCLLWHTEVEAEPIAVPAALLGMDTVSAEAALEQARDKFREGCVHAHRELAPTKDCRFYNRLLDVPIRRGGALLPDVQQHLDECPYCRFAAEQLSHFEGGLGMLLAEAVLGWGARRYLDSRRGQGVPDSRGQGGGRHGGGRRRLLSRIPSPGRRPPEGPRSSRVLLTGVGLASAGLIASVLATSLWSDDGGVDPAASTSATGSESAPDGVSASPPGTAQLPLAPSRSRLRNVGSDLCLDIRGTVRKGAATALETCSDDDTQKWTYDEDDGLLRSAAAPDLCLDSHADAGVVILGTCADDKSKRAADVRYDITVQGELLTRWDDQLAVTSTSGEPDADIVVKVRDGSDQQRWVTDPVSPGTGALSDAGSGAPSVRAVDLSERGRAR